VKGRVENHIALRVATKSPSTRQWPMGMNDGSWAGNQMGMGGSYGRRWASCRS